MKKPTTPAKPKTPTVTNTHLQKELNALRIQSDMLSSQIDEIRQLLVSSAVIGAVALIALAILVRV